MACLALVAVFLAACSGSNADKACELVEKQTELTLKAMAGDMSAGGQLEEVRSELEALTSQLTADEMEKVELCLSDAGQELVDKLSQ